MTEMGHMRLAIEFTDADRVIEYSADVEGEFFAATPDTAWGWNGSTPGEAAHFNAERLIVNELTVWSSSRRSKAGLTFPAVRCSEGTMENYRSWCREILDDCREAIEMAAVEAVERRMEVQS